MTYLSYTTSPAGLSISPEWSYDSAVVSLDRLSNGAVVTGLKEGYSSVTASYGGKSDTCIVTVSGYADTYEDTTEPYIYSASQYLVMQSGDTQMANVSLYNGSAADIDGYTWVVENSSVAAISPTGQYCQIRAAAQGYTRIKVTHTKAAFPYYIGVYVLDDITRTTYITTRTNIVTMQESGGEQTVSVSLANPKSENYAPQFTWQLIEGSGIIATSANAEKCVITPLSEGEATLRVTHPDATYPLDITARVITIVKNVYVEPSELRVVIDGENMRELSVKLHGLAEGADYSPDEFTWELDDESIVSWYTYGNTIVMSGKKNGSAMLNIGHPKARQKRQVLVIVENSAASAIDSSCYITTTQDFIKTKEGADPTTLRVMLKGGDEGDESGFTWEVSQQPENAGKDVISMTTSNGSVSSARATSATYANGSALITPLNEGTATITVRHPKVLYPTEVLVKVLNKGALLDYPLYFAGSGIVRFLNSETYTYEVSLLGSGKSASDDGAIQWESDSTRLKVNASGSQAVLSSTATGSAMSHVTITHPKADAPKSVLVLTADTEEELDALRAFYSDKLYYSINAGSSCYLRTDQAGFDTIDSEGNFTKFDFSATTWTSSNPQVATVEKDGSDPLSAKATGIKAGSATIRASYANIASIDFHITVYPTGVNLDTVEQAKYLTTTQNVVNISGAGKSAAARVSAIGIDGAKCASIAWKSSDESVCTAFPNGTSATINALKEGEAVLTVSHPESENTLKIYVRVGSEYVMTNEPVTYISASADPILLVKDAETISVTAVLANAPSSAQLSGFSFSIADEGVASLAAQYADGKCFVKPQKAGETELTIAHPQAKYPKKILVLVANTEEELAAFRHLTTKQNVVTIAEGDTTQVSVSVENSSEVIVSGYNWSTDDMSVASIASSTGAVAVVKANGTGTTKLRVTNDKCKYPLEIIVQVVDQTAASANPHIYVNNPIVTLTVSTSWTELSADLVGGKDSDMHLFTWTAADSTIVQCYGQNGKGRIRGIKAGVTYVTVSHPKARNPQPVTVIVDNPEAKPCSISVSCGNTLSLKPDAGDQNITATLVGGTDTDKYNFKWSLDVYDVVNLDYNANSAILTPLKEGRCTLTVHHPKSAYDQSVTIKVQRYDNFGFGQNSLRVTQGTVTFIAMQVPASSVQTHVKYSSEAETVVKVTGTDAVCQLTGLTGGQSCVVHADLVAANTGIAQSSADLLVYVEERKTDSIYITGGTTIYTISKGKSVTLSATLVGTGITELDQNSLTWRCSDSSVARISGADITGTFTGRQCLVTAMDGGECTVTISHDKSPVPLTYHVIVPEADAAEVALSKSYIKIYQGRSTELEAKIKNGTNADYKTLVWDADMVGGEEIVRIMGSGNTVSVYGIKAGVTHVRCMLSATGSTAECEIEIEAVSSLEFETQSVRVMPGKTRTIRYAISPPTASIRWQKQTGTGDEFITIQDMPHGDGTGEVEITGIMPGTTAVIAISSYGSMAQLQAICSWDYKLTLNRTSITELPDRTGVIEYTVNPPEAEIQCSSSNPSLMAINADAASESGIGKITLKPKGSGSATVEVTAVNPATGEAFATKKVGVTFAYDRLTLTKTIASAVSTADASKAAYYSAFDGDALRLGDGETVTLKFGIQEQNAGDATYSYAFTSSGDVTGIKMGSDTYVIKSGTDWTEGGYLITEGYSPRYKGSATYDDGKPIKVTDFVFFSDQETFHFISGRSSGWEGCKGGRWGTEHYRRSARMGVRNDVNNTHVWKYATANAHRADESFLLSEVERNNDWTVARDTSLDGKFISVYEFESTAWYYVRKDSYTINDTCPSKVTHSLSEIDTAHVKATYYEQSPETTVSSSEMIGTLTVTVSAGGTTTKHEIPVILDKRPCLCTYRQ